MLQLKIDEPVIYPEYVWRRPRPVKVDMGDDEKWKAIEEAASPMMGGDGELQVEIADPEPMYDDLMTLNVERYQGKDEDGNRVSRIEIWMINTPGTQATGPRLLAAMQNVPEPFTNEAVQVVMRKALYPANIQ